MAADQLTLDRIAVMHPKVRQEVQDMYMHANNNILGKGVRLRFAYTLRTFAEQDALYAQGRTKSGSIVTNAKGGQSFHNYGLAFDIVLLYDKDDNGTFETASWDIHDPNWIKVCEYFQEQGWEWGGSWKSFKDYPHFQKTFGYTTTQLSKRLEFGYPQL